MTSRSGPRRFFFRPPANYYDMPEEERHRWLEELRQDIVAELDADDARGPEGGEPGAKDEPRP